MKKKKKKPRKKTVKRRWVEKTIKRRWVETADPTVRVIKLTAKDTDCDVLRIVPLN